MLRESDFEGAELNSFGRETVSEIIDSYERRNATIWSRDSKPTR